VPLSLIDDVNNWLGRSQWNDAMFQGNFNEFRIWEGALSSEQVAANRAAGPDNLPSETGPELGISLVGGPVVVSWPAAAAGFKLESALKVGADADWKQVDTSGAVEEGGKKKLTVTPSAAATFYRLKQ
jgi:hypothetical protein